MNEMIDQTKRWDPRAMNAYRHGLTGQVRIQTPEEQAAYDRHCEQIHKSLAPAPGMEAKIVQTIAEDQWRLDRAKAIEDSIFVVGLEDENVPEHLPSETFSAIALAHTWLANDKKIALLALYAQRAQNAIHRNIQLLRQLQQDRHAALEKAAAECNLLAQRAESKGETYNPTLDFPTAAIPAQFDISTVQIAHLANHRRRLADLDFTPHVPEIPLRRAA